MMMMKTKLFGSAAAAALGLAMTCAAPASANVLVNAGFETGDLTGWNLGGPVQTVGAPVVGAYSGNFALSLEVPGDGVADVNQGAFGGANPVLPASPGQEWNMSGYVLTEAPLPAVGAGATFGLYKIVFEDAAGNDLVPASASIGIINNANPGVEAVPFLDGNTPVNQWVFSEAQGVAPAGTVSVQFLALNVDFGNGGSHEMWFDNVSATLIPEPASMALLSLGGLALLRRK